MVRSGIVGLMGLTFFCNKCVEVFYDFVTNGQLTDELREICQKAITSFNSLKGPSAGRNEVEKLALFDTNEEIKSLMRSFEEPNSDQKKFLDELIDQLQSIIDDSKSISERQIVAEKLQIFFDRLGDYSFYATNDCLKGDENTVGV